MHALLLDLRYALRSLAIHKGFAAVAILTLALGIGANTAIFSAVNAVLLRPLPYRDAARLHIVYEDHPEPVRRTRLSAENFLDLQRDVRSFEDVGAFVGTGFTLSGNGDPELVIGQMISAQLMEILGVQPLLGRTLRADENEGGRDQVMLLSHALWQRRYGGDPSIVGRTITANGKPYTVVGVMPPDFEFPSKRYQLWVPFAFRNNPTGLVNRRARFIQVVGRLRADVPADQARTELATIARRLAETYPEDNADVTMRMASLTDETVGDVRGALFLLLCAVGFVVLIACANVTNLLLARASTRQREVAVRTALGASRARLIRQLLTETLVLYGLGAAAGLLLAAWGVGGLIAISPADIPRLDRTSLDLPTVAFALTVTLLTALVFGAVPAWQATRFAPSEHLKAAARTTTAGRASQGFRAALVTAEVALSLMLLIGAGLAVRSLAALHRVDTGIRPDGVLTFGVLPPETRYPDGDRLRRFHAELLDRLAVQPGTLAVGATTHLPLSGQDVENSFTPEGWSPPTPTEQAIAGLRGIGGRYFDAVGARIVAGRPLGDSDTARSALTAVVNEQFARRYWPGQNAVGKRLKLGSSTSEDPWRSVVGVYADVAHMGPERTPRPEVMLPYQQLDDAWLTRWMRGVSVVLRSQGDPASAVPASRDTVRSLDASIPLIEPRRMTALLDEALAQPRFRSILFGSFAVLAMLLAAVGIYGVLAYVVEQRAHEISVRVALGARPGSVVALVVKQGSRPVIAGVAAGLAGAYVVAQAMQGLLFEVAPVDPVTFVAMPLFLMAVGLAACVLPARRALSVDPAEALRTQ